MPGAGDGGSAIGADNSLYRGLDLVRIIDILGGEKMDNDEIVDQIATEQQINARLNNLIREQRVALEAWDAARAGSRASVIACVSIPTAKAGGFQKL